MAFELVESLTAAGFGAADAAIAAKVTQKLPGKLSMSFGFEVAGVLAGVYGGKLGLGEKSRDPIMFAALGALGARAARLAMAGKLFQFSQWGVGGAGDGAGGDGFALSDSSGAAVSGGDGWGGGAPAVPFSRIYGGARNAPGVRMLPGRGGSFGLYPSTTEIAGTAG